MNNREEVIPQLENIVDPIVRKANLELVDIEFGQERGRGLIRVYIDGDAGVTVNQCESVSRDISLELDNQDGLIKGSYLLEVSSPGLDRPFKKESDYQRNLGRLVKIITHTPVDGKNVFIGQLRDILTGPDNYPPAVMISDSETKKIVKLELKNISIARREIHWDEIFGGKHKSNKHKKRAH